MMARAHMPPEQPLQRPIQDLSKPYRDAAAPPSVDGDARGWRVLTFVPAFLTTLALGLAFLDWFATGGVTWLESALIGLITVTFFWISLSVATVTTGVLRLVMQPGRPATDLPVQPMKVALVVPCYNEVPADVFGNAAAMLNSLDTYGSKHRYSLFVLSDTVDARVAALELSAFETLREQLPAHLSIYYRRRLQNIDRKVGNLADWIERWGGGYDAMLVLDADSLMSGEAIVSLTDELASDPATGLIQSFPQLMGAETLFARVQQFASFIYGAILAEGLATWTQREGNYWGHNAIIRTSAFAACAGLPKTKSITGKGQLILSHDFVEASLLRRAGWAVRFLPRIKGSYEEVPATLIDYVLRDRRWCHGNLQHLKLLASNGFHPISRFHLFQGAMSYLLSPAWFLLVLTWALIGTSSEQNVITYFSGLNPQVQWPEMTAGHSGALLAFMYGMLLAPKAFGAAVIGSMGLRLADLGGAWRFASSLVIELVMSILYAPILMVQQTKAVGKAIIGKQMDWKPQQRAGGRYGLWELLRFHWLETLAGTALVLGMMSGLVSLWLFPIAVSLAFAVVLSAMSSLHLARFTLTAQTLGTEEVFNAPDIIVSARRQREQLRSALEARQTAAE